MKVVKKFTTFEDLKASETKTLNNDFSIEKHLEFEKVIKNIHFHKIHPAQAFTANSIRN